MSELKGKELEHAIAEQLGKKLSPEEKLAYEIESHINDTDMLLQAVLDVAEAGEGSSDTAAMGRFAVIQELLGQYRERQQKFIKSLYAKKAA